VVAFVVAEVVMCRGCATRREIIHPISAKFTKIEINNGRLVFTAF